MSVLTPPRLMTTEELFALPDDDVDRWLIRGELREEGMTRRSRAHAGIEARLATLLNNWNDKQSPPQGRVYSGDLGFRLRKDPDTTVGVDVAYVSPEVEAANAGNPTILDGAPSLAIEILSPSNTYRRMHEKTVEYLAAGTAHVWIVDPDGKTVTVHRPGRHPELFNVDQELTAEPELTGLRIAVKDIFNRL